MVDPFHCVPDEEFETAAEALLFLLDEPSLSIEGVLIDLDGVLMDVHGAHPAPEVDRNVSADVVELLQAVHEKYGACIVTNRIRYSDFNPEYIERVFGVPVVTDTRTKPNKEIFYAGIDRLGLDRDQRSKVVMVGDSSYQDTYGASKAGLQTIQVEGQHGNYDWPERIGKRLADGVQLICKRLDSSERGIQ